MPLTHDIEDHQQPPREIPVQALPVAVSLRQHGAQQLHLRRGKSQRRQGRRRHQLFALQQCCDLRIGRSDAIVESRHHLARAQQADQERRRAGQQRGPCTEQQQAPLARTWTAFGRE
jgi:hypothetical protein